MPIHGIGTLKSPCSPTELRPLPKSVATPRRAGKGPRRRGRVVEVGCGPTSCIKAVMLDVRWRRARRRRPSQSR